MKRAKLNLVTRFYRMLFLSSIGASPLQSCAASPAIKIDDLKLIRVEIVQQEWIPKQDRFWDDGVITAPLFKITFRSKFNLEVLARTEHYNIDNVTSLCRNSTIDQSSRLRGFPSVFDSVGRIDEFRAMTKPGNNTIREDGFEYHVYFDIRQSGIRGFYSYDLVHQSADVCITVNGTQEIAFGIANRFTSNTLLVPKEMISAATAEAGVR